MSAAQSKIDAGMMAQLQELLGDRFAELIERFLSDSTRRMELLRTAVPARDFDVMHAEAHGLKGSSRNIGANCLAQACGELEDKGREKDGEQVENLLVVIEQEFVAVCEALKTY